MTTPIEPQNLVTPRAIPCCQVPRKYLQPPIHTSILHHWRNKLLQTRLPRMQVRHPQNDPSHNATPIPCFPHLPPVLLPTPPSPKQKHLIRLPPDPINSRNRLPLHRRLHPHPLLHEPNVPRPKRLQRLPLTRRFVRDPAAHQPVAGDMPAQHPLQRVQRIGLLGLGGLVAARPPHRPVRPGRVQQDEIELAGAGGAAAGGVEGACCGGEAGGGLWGDDAEVEGRMRGDGVGVGGGGQAQLRGCRVRVADEAAGERGGGECRFRG